MRMLKYTNFTIKEKSLSFEEGSVWSEEKWLK